MEMEAFQIKDPGNIIEKAFGKQCKSVTSNSSKNLAQQRYSYSASNKNSKNSEKKLKKDFAKMAIQNESLAKLLKKKNSEIADLKRSSESLHGILSAMPDDDLHLTPVLANHKLVEVNNHNRKLSCELLSTKNQLNKKDLELKQKDLNLRLIESKLQKIRKLDVTKSNKSELKGHMVDLDKMIASVHSKNIELASQLNSAIKCLQSETGHQWDLKEFIFNPTDWEGRAKKIKNLEQQLVQYNEQIECYKNLLNTDISSKKLFPEALNYETVSTVDIIKSAKIKALEAENTNLRKNLEKQKSTSLNLRVRNEALNEEVLQCRTLICSIEQHSSHSKNSMASLRDMVIQQQRDYDKRIAELYGEINSWKKKVEEAKGEERATKLKLDMTEKTLQDSSAHIEDLMRKNQKLEDDFKAYCGGFLFSCRDLRKEEFVAILEALEIEKKHLLSKIEKLEKKLSVATINNDYLTKELMDQQVLIGQLEIQLEDSKLTKSTEIRNLIQKAHSMHTEEICVTKSLEASSATSLIEQDSQKSNEYKIRLKVAEDTIQELRQKVSTLTAEKMEESDFFQAMINKSKETILETIHKYSCSCGRKNNSTKEPVTKSIIPHQI